jgi:hypothetical protein
MSVTANFTPVPLTLPGGLKGINYFPRGHAWWSMLNDWYTQDCATSTEPASCKPGQTVAQVVAADLQTLSQSGFNFLHQYLWDQDIVQSTFGSASLVTAATSPGIPGFTGWDAGGPQNSPNNQWAALGAFVSLAKQYNMWLMLEFAASRPGMEVNLYSCGHTVCPPVDGGSCPYPPSGWSYPDNSSCPSGCGCTQFTNAAVGCNYAAWVNSFIDYLAPNQNVLIWGAWYGVGFGATDPFWQTSCGSSGGAYQQIMSHLQQHPYSSPAGRALLAVGEFYGFVGPPSPACHVYPPPVATGTDPQLGPYTPDWLGAQQSAYVWQNLPSGEPAPDIYSVGLWNSNAGDLQALLECWSGTPNSVCPGTQATCNTQLGQCPIPASKMIVTEFGAGSSFEAGPIGNQTASFGDSQEPTTSAAGQAQMLTQTLCAMKTVGVRNTGQFGLYDSYSWWASNFPDSNASGLAWEGFWGLKSEVPSSYNPNSDGAKPAWGVMSAVNPYPASCPAAGVPPTPVIAVLPADGGVPTAGANPYYTVNDTANVFYTGANVTSLSMSPPPGIVPAASSWACDVPSTRLASGSALVGSCGYALFTDMSSVGTGLFTLSGSNNDVDGAQVAASTQATPVNTPVTVGLAPIVTGLVDFNNTSQQCNLTTNPSCTLTVSQLDTIEVFGAGFNPTGGNTITLTNQGNQQVLSISDGYYFWDASRTQMNAQIGCFVPAGSWTLSVVSPNTSSLPSAGSAITVNASASCN